MPSISLARSLPVSAAFTAISRQPSNEFGRNSREAHQWFLRRLERVGRDSSASRLTRDKESLHSVVLESWEAMARIYGLGAIETPLERAPWLLEAAELDPSSTNVLLKLETQQLTGSFKARGAIHKLLSLSPAQMEKGIVTSSTGNHALAVLGAIRGLLKSSDATCPIHIYVPSTISARKAAKLAKAAAEVGAEIVEIGEDCLEAEVAARKAAMTSGQTYISPYNDLHVIGGQGTIAFELLMSLETRQLDVVYVPVGGGGLVSGVASVLKSLSPDVYVVGCQPERSQVMRCLLEQSLASAPTPPLNVIDKETNDLQEETLSDGTAGGIEEGSMTIEFCREFVDEWVSVTEEEIAHAMVAMERHSGRAIEGAAGVAVAGYLRSAQRLSNKGMNHAVVICCGGNVAPETMEKAYDLVNKRHRQR